MIVQPRLARRRHIARHSYTFAQRPAAPDSETAGLHNTGTGLVLPAHVDVIPGQVLIGSDHIANTAPHRIYPEQIPRRGAG
jgi:hypothetical protein